MALKDIVVHLDPGTVAEDVAATIAALTIAKACAAHVTALVFDVEKGAPVSFRTGAKPDLGPEALHTPAERVAATRQSFLDAADREGVACAAVTELAYTYAMGDVLGDYMRVKDLAVLGVGDPLSDGQRLLLETALFESGRPALLVPADYRMSTMPKKVMIAWDSTAPAARAAAAALPFLDKAEAIVVTVADDKALRPGQEGTELAHHLAHHGVKATFEAIERGSGGVVAAVARAAEARGADLVVMGAFAHSKLRSLVFGSATEEVFRGTVDLPVLMTH